MDKRVRLCQTITMVIMKKKMYNDTQSYKCISKIKEFRALLP